MTRSIVVLGSTGLLGQALMQEARRQGWQAMGLSRGSGVDLAHAASLAAVLDPLRPAMVINAAANTKLESCEQHPREAHALHVRLPALLASWCCSHRVPWVQVSTDHYYCGPRNELHAESAPVWLCNEYARSKYVGESLAAASELCLVLRTNIVGFRRWAGQPTFVEWAIAALRGSEPFTAYDDVWASSIEVGQFAQALFEMVDRGAHGIYNLAAREASSKADFIAALAAALGLDARHCRVAHRPAQTEPMRANALGLDVGRAEAVLGRLLPTAAEVIAALARQYRKELPEQEHAACA
jgi:dTDP-4-dehydrorhamnose reductase